MHYTLETAPEVTPTLENEKQLIDHARKDSRRFAPLYAHYFESVYRFVWSKVRNGDLAGDLTSQVFSKAITALPKYKHQGVALGAWLMRIAINEVNLHYRERKKAAEVSLTTELVDGMLDALETAPEPDKRQALIDGLNALDAASVSLLEMRFFEEMRFSEMGAILGISEDNAKVRTYRALRALKTIIFADDAQV